jgi:hypothetical protein
MADFTLLADVKAFAGVTAATWDTEIGGIISAVSAMLARHVGHDYDATSRTEKISGTRQPAVIVSRPIQTLTSVALDDTTLTVDDDYEFTVGQRAIYRLASGLGSIWELGNRNVTAIYAPVSTVPDDLELAAREASAFVWKQSHQSGASRLGLENKGNDTGGLSQYITDILTLPVVQTVVRERRPVY